MWFLYFGSDLSLNLIHPAVQLGVIYIRLVLSVWCCVPFKAHVGLLATSSAEQEGLDARLGPRFVELELFFQVFFLH